MKGNVRWKALLEVLWVSMRLGVTSFGGPIAHLGYFHEEYVRRRKWLDERSYADIVALCQFLPGPASSQVGMGIGMIRAGVLGAIVAFLGFTLPSVLLLILFALFLQGVDVKDIGWIHGLKIVAVVVVAHAIMWMAQKLTPDLKRKSVALVALTGTLLWQTSFTQIIIILLSAMIGYLFFQQYETEESRKVSFSFPRSLGYLSLVFFFGLLFLLPILKEFAQLPWIDLFDRFYRSGALVFGGGHVVLPLLEREFVPTGLLTEKEFLTGYGAAQTVPGPLFTFAAYIGAMINGWQGGLLATVAIFLPAFLLLMGTLPLWNALRKNAKIQGALAGVNAAVVGILIAAFYTPIWTSSIRNSIDFAFGAILFYLLAYWKLPPWIIVVTGALGGWLIAML